jgi:site-specific DNA recombinase
MNNPILHVAMYARVSSEAQAIAQTIESQLAALRERISADGFSVSDESQFIDDGYSGASLIRPALERLRDCVALGGIDRLYVHSPDRLARKYAYQVLLVDEFRRMGVDIVFLNRELGRSPEDDLLLQVQGMISEYERAKIIERHRRGKRHAAHIGSVNVLSGAPFGYRYISKGEAGGQARYEILHDEARVVQQIFEWIGRDRLTIGEVCRRLNKTAERTRFSKRTWDRSVVWAALKNPAYIGEAAFGKTRTEAFRPALRQQRGRPAQPRRPQRHVDAPPEEWIKIPVPAIVDTDLFKAVQQQLEDNRSHARQRKRGARYLLQGLICCKACGYAYYGKAISPSSRKHHPREYAYYRCLGTDAYRFGGERICKNTQVRTDLMDLAVWQEVTALLEDPGRLVHEYTRRLTPKSMPRDGSKLMIEKQLKMLRQSITRLIDAYTDGHIEKHEFEPRMNRMRERIKDLEAQAEQLCNEEGFQRELQLIIGRLEDFSAKVKSALGNVDWTTQRDLIRTLVKRVEVEQGGVNIVFRADRQPQAQPSVLQDCRGRNQRSAEQCVPTLCPRPLVRACSKTSDARRGVHDQVHRRLCDMFPVSK